MKQYSSHLLFSALLLFTALSPQRALAQNASPSYQKELEQWHQKRMAYLLSDTGWVNLAGLFWLQPGKNSFGSGDKNALVFPKDRIAAKAGTFTWKNDAVWLHSAKNANISMLGQKVTKAMVFQKDTLKNRVLSSGSLRFNVIARDKKIGIRLRDLNHPALATFPGIELFPADTSWVVTAKLIPPAPGQTIAITNVLGQTTQQASPGTVVFTLQGNTYTLQSLEEEGKLFLIFGDATNGDITYPSGRFLYAAMPNQQGETILDFNKAFNPPCAFTPFATCPLPPKQNRLKLAITAGEKNFSNHH